MFSRVFVLSCTLHTHSYMSMYCLWMSLLTFLVSSKLQGVKIVSLYVTMSYVVMCVHVCVCTVQVCACVRVYMCAYVYTVHVWVGVSVVGSTRVLGVLRVPSTHPRTDPLS